MTSSSGSLRMSERRPVVILSPVRNEIHNLRRSLPVWELIADNIVVADQGSTDGSRELLSSREKVIVVDNPGSELSEPRRKALLVEAARKVHPGAIHVMLDADEILSSNVLTSPEWTSFCRSDPGTLGRFSWIHLWGSPQRYISRGALAPSLVSVAFIDDGRAVEGAKVMHEERGVGVRHAKKQFIFNDVVCLHYGMLNRDALVRRNNYYKVFWVLKGAKRYHLNNKNHRWYRGVRECNTALAPEQWLRGYISRSLDVTSVHASSLYWWDIEILRAFKREGIEKFYRLDIWREVDWEQLRQSAIAEGVEGISDEPIKMPGRIRRGYQALTLDGVNIAELPAKAHHFIVAKLLP